MPPIHHQLYKGFDEMLIDRMQFMIPKRGKRATHLWFDEDTYCRMFSTGGIRKIQKYIITSDLTRGSHNRFCAMCENRYAGNTCPSSTIYEDLKQ